ncbi:MAG: hypothetical protein WD795_05345 [Woeseia sp.]
MPCQPPLRFESDSNSEDGRTGQSGRPSGGSQNREHRETAGGHKYFRALLFGLVLGIEQLVRCRPYGEPHNSFAERFERRDLGPDKGVADLRVLIDEITDARTAVLVAS